MWCVANLFHSISPVGKPAGSKLWLPRSHGDRSFAICYRKWVNFSKAKPKSKLGYFDMWRFTISQVLILILACFVKFTHFSITFGEWAHEISSQTHFTAGWWYLWLVCWQPAGNTWPILYHMTGGTDLWLLYAINPAHSVALHTNYI